MNIRAKAPLRISFAGGGTDVPPYPELHGGCVLNATINYYAFGALHSRHDRTVKLNSADFDLQIEFDAAEEVSFDGKLDFPKAAIKRLGALNSNGFDIFLQSEAPPGSGLGSSSALMVTLVGLLKELKALPLDNYEVAHLAYVMERQDLGIKGGLQDQYAATFGGFNFMEFDKDRVIVNTLRINRDTLNELEHNLVLCHTNTARRSDRIIDDQTSRLEAGNTETVNALAQQKELAVAMKNALLRNRLDDFGELMHSAWQAKKRLSNRISNSQIDELYEQARKQGALGGKITGAGGGGFMLFYCEFERRHKVVAQLRKMGAVPAEFAFNGKGLETWKIQEAEVFGAIDRVAASAQVRAV